MSTYSSKIVYGKGKISFQVMLTKRKTMEIAVHPNGIVIVKAPTGTLPEKIKARIVKRARWINKQIDYFKQFDPRTPSRYYVGGETHLYLGRQYRLKLKKRKQNEVKLKGSYFHVMTSDTNNKQIIKSLLDEWYKEHARSVFSRQLELSYAKAKNLKVPFPKIQLKEMSKRWGSCSKAGDIILNTNLIKAPLYSIDYVIMHELCHLKNHTHDKGYYKLLAKYMPDWERRKERLERAVV